MHDPWSMFHSPRCIMGARLVIMCPRRALETKTANATDVSMLCQQNLKTRKLAPARVSHWDDVLIFFIAFTWWLGHFTSCYLKVHFMLIKYTCGSKSQTLRMRYPFQPTERPISHRNEWSFRVYMIPLRDFVPEWNSRPGTRTGVNSRRGDSRRHNILLWYHANKYRAMRRNRSELALGWKAPRCHVNAPWAF